MNVACQSGTAGSPEIRARKRDRVGRSRTASISPRFPSLSLHGCDSPASALLDEPIPLRYLGEVPLLPQVRIRVIELAHVEKPVKVIADDRWISSRSGGLPRKWFSSTSRPFVPGIRRVVASGFLLGGPASKDDDTAAGRAVRAVELPLPVATAGRLDDRLSGAISQHQGEVDIDPGFDELGGDEVAGQAGIEARPLTASRTLSRWGGHIQVERWNTRPEAILLEH